MQSVTTSTKVKISTKDSLLDEFACWSGVAAKCGRPLRILRIDDNTDLSGAHYALFRGHNPIDSSPFALGDGAAMLEAFIAYVVLKWCTVPVPDLKPASV